jgi:predicted CoA-substrate-specific enzyme activase
MICAGIDAGSRTLKVVLFEADGQGIVASGVVDQGVDQDALAAGLLEKLLADGGLPRGDLRGVVATGYGRKLIRVADATVTEVTCQGWGVRSSAPEARTVIDIGGQDSKLLRLRPDGTVADFVMNDRCAAGCGRFLEVLADQLGVQLGSLGQMAGRSRLPAIISSMCVVFAETEIIGLLAEGVAPADIAAGVQNAIALRVATLASRTITPPVCFTGGVALQSGMVRALETALACPVSVSPLPQYTGALGAAILASRQSRRQGSAGTL